MATTLTAIFGHYDRLEALINGTVKPEGIDLRIEVNSKDQDRQRKAINFDMAEFYTGRYVVDLPHNTFEFTAIPVFIKRMFRHSYIYINKHAGIRRPADLNGKRIGVQNWFTTTALWARGILEEDYGVDLKSITWVHNETEKIGGWEPPTWLKLETVPKGANQMQMLASGSLDAGITTELWAPNVHPAIDFLFPNYAELEREYFKRTGFFPIMHTLLIKTKLLEKDPWIAMSMFNACEQSKRRCYEWLERQRIHLTSLWFRALWEEERAAAGPDIYLWGFKNTRSEVDKLLDYCFRQGFTRRRYHPEEIFHSSTLST